MIDALACSGRITVRSDSLAVCDGLWEQVQPLKDVTEVDVSMMVYALAQGFAFATTFLLVVHACRYIYKAIDVM